MHKNPKQGSIKEINGKYYIYVDNEFKRYYQNIEEEIIDKLDMIINELNKSKKNNVIDLNTYKQLVKVGILLGQANPKVNVNDLVETALKEFLKQLTQGDVL